VNDSRVWTPPARGDFQSRAESTAFQAVVVQRDPVVIDPQGANHITNPVEPQQLTSPKLMRGAAALRVVGCTQAPSGSPADRRLRREALHEQVADLAPEASEGMSTKKLVLAESAIRETDVTVHTTPCPPEGSRPDRREVTTPVDNTTLAR
jgi:hypothetical protein